MSARLILSCEHAGNHVPAEHRRLFRGAAHVLNSHRGWDPGALSLGRTFARRLAAPFLHHDETRLLVELNRSVGHRRLFSEFTKGLGKVEKEFLLRDYYYPHRDRVESWILKHVERDRRVLHVSLHTFAPRLNGRVRNADVGLLYDPSRELEKALCLRWQSTLKQRRPGLRIRRNYPYLGKADGFTTYLRGRFGEPYAGIELEVNQAWPTSGATDWRRLRKMLADSLANVWVTIDR